MVEFVLLAIKAAIHHFLFQRKVYPERWFKSERVFLTYTQACRHPAVREYISEATGSIKVAYSPHVQLLTSTLETSTTPSTPYTEDYIACRRQFLPGTLILFALAYNFQAVRSTRCSAYIPTSFFHARQRSVLRGRTLTTPFVAYSFSSIIATSSFRPQRKVTQLCCNQ